ncbi:hypothetical protein THRCLA_08864 [Thraustotheca clavata]|uniref:Serine protease family S33 n=1 Tax=Thraustotheca clavata TaxID=74557 RepID=A0A1V9Z1C7_9STRA|nr:hypothetical protein THRCLA_08864 [Thraustotheca clavata]
MWHPWQLLSTLRLPARVLDKVTKKHHKYLDHVTAKLTHNPLLFPEGFFCDGWGDLQVPTRLNEHLATEDKFRVIEIHELKLVPIPKKRLGVKKPSIVTLQGSFATTLRDYQSLLPQVCHSSYFELVLPSNMVVEAENGIKIDGKGQAIVILLPGTGEHGCTHRRRSIAEPLAKVGVATLVLEGPFYGCRKPADQKGSKLRRVSDLPILGITTIEETKSLLEYFKTTFHFDHLVVAGGSMGGLHAAMTAALYPGEVGVASWIAPPSAIPPFTRGLLGLSCNWQSLSQQRELAMIDHLLSNQVANYAFEQFHHFVHFQIHDEQHDELAQIKQRLSAFLSLTNIENFPAPRRQDAVIFSQATEDQYIGTNEQHWQLARSRWPLAEFRQVTAGHVSGILFETDAFQKTILDVIKRLKE